MDSKTVTTIREYAEAAGVSYEAIRQQLARYAEDLEGHIIKQGRKTYLDSYAVSFLDTHRNPKIIIEPGGRLAEIDSLNAEIERLAAQNDALKNKLIELHEDFQKAGARLIEAQRETNEARLLLSDHTHSLEAARAEADRLRSEAERIRTQAEAERAKLLAELDELKSRKWWQFWKA